MAMQSSLRLGVAFGAAFALAVQSPADFTSSRGASANWNPSPAVHGYDLTAAGQPELAGAVGPTIEIQPTVSTLADGSTLTTYDFPNGEVMSTTTPPPGFDPLTASASALAEVSFPSRPSDTAELSDWTAAMAAFRSDDPPSGPLAVVLDGPSGADAATKYTNWGGYVDGSWGVQSHAYVAVKALFHVPTNLNTCSSSSDGAFWVGMGGTYSTNNLVQQGIICGNPNLGNSSAYRPFTEFCCPTVGGRPTYFCGYTTWTLPAGDAIYQNMSFQTSGNRAYFYLEDETTGVVHSCSLTPPSGWSWDLNTSEWVAETPAGSPVDFQTIHFSDAETELYSTSSWVTMGSQSPLTEVIVGSGVVGGHLYECIAPGSISGGTAFTDYYEGSDCYF